MAVTKFSSGSSFKNLTKYDDFLAGNAAYDPAATWLIQRIAGTGSSGTITFSSIPQTYSSLQLRILGKDTNTTSITLDGYVQLNGDAGSNYSYHYLRAGGGTVSASGGYPNSVIIMPNAFSSSKAATPAQANIYGVAIVDIHDYTSTTRNKTVRIFGGSDSNLSDAAIGPYLASGSWNNTAAVTSVSIVAGGTAWTTGTTIALYGMK